VVYLADDRIVVLTCDEPRRMLQWYDPGDDYHTPLSEAVALAPDLDPPKEQAPKPEPAKKRVKDKEARARILNVLKGGPMHEHEIGTKTGLRKPRIGKLLRKLQDAAQIEQHSPGVWQLYTDPEPVAAEVLERIKT
jgi:hypothetical protein